MTSRRDPMDIDHVRLAIIALAKVHSLSWAYSQLVEPHLPEKFPWLTTVNYAKEDVEAWKVMLHSNIETAISLLNAHFGEGEGNKHSEAVRNFKSHSVSVLHAVLGNRTNVGLDSFFRTTQDPGKVGKLEDNAGKTCLIDSFINRN